jgi:hypothetical protein
MLRLYVLILAALVGLTAVQAQTGDKGAGGVTVDKGKRLIRIDARVAPRKLEYLKGAVYPIEVVACWPHPRGKKAHETVVTVEALPSAVHAALVQLGLKPGTPVLGQSKQPPQGPECKVYLEIPDSAGTTRRVSLDKTLVDERTGKPFPKSVTWRFTGSVLSDDPATGKKVYGADMSGTLITIFPVTDQAVFQTNLTMEYEHLMKLETTGRCCRRRGRR